MSSGSARASTAWPRSLTKPTKLFGGAPAGKRVVGTDLGYETAMDEMICEACGGSFELADALSDVPPTSMREPNGRATYEHAGSIRHQCDDSSFVEVDEVHPNAVDA